MDLTSIENTEELKSHPREKNEPKPSNEAMLVEATTELQLRPQKQNQKFRCSIRGSRGESPWGKIEY